MRATLRKIAIWFFASFMAMLFFGVGGEWLIHVAEDKGFYKNAGQRWDRAVAAIEAAFSWLADVALSTPFLMAMAASGGLALGLSLNKKAEPDGKVVLPAESPTPEVNLQEVMAAKLARAEIIRRGLPEIFEKIDVLDQMFNDWLKCSEVKIFGSGLSSGNYRAYAFIPKMQIPKALWDVLDAIQRISPPGSSIELPNVMPADVILSSAPNEKNLYNVLGDAPDQDRKIQHRLWYEKHRQNKEYISGKVQALKSELALIEQDIRKAAGHVA